MQMDMVESLWTDERIVSLREGLFHHPLYANLKTHEDIHVFMESHVFAVWDFMSLLKSLQHRFTGLTVPWTPTMHPRICNLMNEMVLVEESDSAADGISHFEWYLDAMDQAEANLEPILKLLQTLDAGEDADNLWTVIPVGPQAFVRRTLSIARYAPTHVLAAEFMVGRENLIPDMFPHLVASLNSTNENRLSHLVSYLKRHIEVDGGEHSTYAREVLAVAIDEQEIRLKECIDTAIKSLEARTALWDHILKQIEVRRQGTGAQTNA